MKKNYRTLTALLVLVFAVSFGFKGCNKDKEWNGGISNKNIATTQQGVRVFSPNKIPPVYLGLIDDGFDNLRNAVKESPYSKFWDGLNSDQYIVGLQERSSQCKQAGFTVRLGDAGSIKAYDGSIWDKDPAEGKVLICIAGALLGYGNGTLDSTRARMVVVADANTLPNIVWYEAEHNVAWFGDKKLWEATRYHSQDNGHPIFHAGVSNNLREQGHGLTDAEGKPVPIVIEGGTYYPYLVQ